MLGQQNRADKNGFELLLSFIGHLLNKSVIFVLSKDIYVVENLEI